MTLKSKFYLEISVSVCIFLAFAWLGWFFFGMVDEEAQRITASQNDLAQLDAQQRQISDVSNQYNDAKNTLSRAEGLLLPEQDKLSFIKLVEQLSQETSVTHIINTVVEPSPDATSQSAARAPGIVFNINVLGDFPNLLRFIYLLENGPYYVTLERVQMTGGAAAPAPSQAQDNSEAPQSKNPVAMQLSAKVFSSFAQ